MKSWLYPRFRFFFFLERHVRLWPFCGNIFCAAASSYRTGVVAHKTVDATWLWIAWGYPCKGATGYQPNRPDSIEMETQQAQQSGYIQNGNEMIESITHDCWWHLWPRWVWRPYYDLNVTDVYHPQLAQWWRSLAVDVQKKCVIYRQSTAKKKTKSTKSNFPPSKKNRVLNSKINEQYMIPKSLFRSFLLKKILPHRSCPIDRPPPLWTRRRAVRTLA